MSKYCRNEDQDSVEKISIQSELDADSVPTQNFESQVSELTQQLTFCQARFQKVQKFHEMLSEKLEKQEKRIELLYSVAHSIDSHYTSRLSDILPRLSASEELDKSSISRCCVIY